MLLVDETGIPENNGEDEDDVVGEMEEKVDADVTLLEACVVVIPVVVVEFEILDEEEDDVVEFE